VVPTFEPYRVSVTIKMKTSEQYFLMVLITVMCWVVLTIIWVSEEIIKCDQTSVLSFLALYFLLLLFFLQFPNKASKELCLVLNVHNLLRKLNRNTITALHLSFQHSHVV